MHVEPFRLDSARYPLKVRVLARYAGTYPGSLEIGIGVLRIGRSSFRYGMAMFQDGACVSVSEAVLVYADEHGTAPLPEAYRRRLEGWLIAAP